jgi:hypothetical protein
LATLSLILTTRQCRVSPPERPVAHKVLLVDDDDAVRAEVGTPNSPNTVRCKALQTSAY